MDEFVCFVRTYKEAYRAVKRVSPTTKVFVSFQYEFIRIVDHKEPGKVAEHAKVIDVFRPELDLVAITSYPADFYKTPDDLPINYYAHLRKYLKPSEEVIVMEIGWPSERPSTPANQERFVQRLPVLMTELSPSITAWSLLHDVRIAQFGSNLNSTGLLGAAGEQKPAYAVFRKLATRTATRFTDPPR